MSYETNDKMVSHPDHYKSGKYEVIDIIDEFCKDLTGTEAVCTANAIKYILRWKKKNGVQDLKKAVWYLTHLIETFTGEGLGEPQGGYTIGQSAIDKAVEEQRKQRKHECSNFPWGNCLVSRKGDIDDEPEDLGLRKNAAGVYIPKDVEVRSCKNCNYGYISSKKEGTYNYGPCVGHAGNHYASVGGNCRHWELKKEEE